MLSDYENVKVFIDTVASNIEPTIKGITDNYELFSAPYEKGTVIALVVPKDIEGKVSEALIKSSFIDIEQLHEKGEPAAIRKSIDEGTAKAEDSLKAVNAELAELEQ